MQTATKKLTRNNVNVMLSYWGKHKYGCILNFQAFKANKNQFSMKLFTKWAVT